jgi:hypothetical protein
MQFMRQGPLPPSFFVTAEVPSRELKELQKVWFHVLCKGAVSLN